MTQHISDSLLGSRFWAVSDIKDKRKIANPQAPGAAPANTALKGVKHDSTLTSFVYDGGDTMAHSAVQRAELFAASHVVNAEDAQAESQWADTNLAVLIGDAAAVNTFVNETAAAYTRIHPDTNADEVKAFCRTALRKLMVTSEFNERAHIALPEPPPANGRKLGAEGKLALKNAVIGLASMLKDGKISEKAVLILSESDYYDAANRADLVRLTANSAQRVKTMFVGAARFDALIRQCQEAFEQLGPDVPQQRREQLEAQIARLRELKDIAVREREAAVSMIKTDYALSDPTGKVKSDREFQGKQLEEIRDSLRAFRYGMDCARGKSMGKMERMRRFFDQVRSSFKSENLLNEKKLQAIRTADTNFNSCLREIRVSLFGANEEAQPQDMDVYEKVSDDVNLTDTMDVDASADAATQLSHLTNDRIRYHYSGVEMREEENFKALSKELGDIAENGGVRTVTLRAGVDAIFGLDLKGLALNVKAGGTVDITAQIKVENADGSVSITYSVGGGAQASATAKIGADPKANVPESGFGAKLEGKANIGLSRSVTKTYPSLREFAKTASHLNMVMTPRPREVFYEYGTAAIKGVGHLFMLGATVTGFRISRSKMDQVAFSAELRNRNVFGETSGVFLKKRNVEVIAERTTIGVKGGVQVGADAGLYFQTGEDSVGSNVDFGGSLAGDYSREMSASGKLYKSFAKSLTKCSAAYLENLFNTEPSNDDAWKTSLQNIITFGAAGNPRAIAENLSNLSKKLTELEDSAIGKDTSRKNTAFWQGFAEKARLLAVATALLTKRAEALDDAAEGAEDAKAAAKAAVNYIIAHLANPVVKIPQKIFKENFHDIFNVTTPRLSHLSGSFTVYASFLDNFIDDKMDKLGIGEDAESFLGGVGNTAGNAAVDIAKETSGVSSKIVVKVTKESVVSKHKDARPWLNSGKTSLDIRVSANLTMRVILDVIARHYVKSAGGLDELDEAKWKDEFVDGLKDGLKMAGEDVLISNTAPFLEMTLSEAAEKYPALEKLIGGANFLKDKYEADYAFKDDTFKTLHFEFSADGRFAGFTFSEDYDTEGKLEFTPLEYLSVNLSLSSKTSVTDWSVIPKPSVNSILKRAADYGDAGNPEGFSNFLARNKKGVIRLIQAGKDHAPARPNDKYWQKDVAAMRKTFTDCEALLGELIDGDGRIAESAKSLHPVFTALVNEVKNQNALNPEEELDLAARFFTVASQIYTLKAMQGE